MPAARADPQDLYDDAGPRCAPPLLFVHGAMLDRYTWAPQGALAARFRVLSPDLPWHGRHRPAQELLGIDACACFLLAVLDQAQVEHAAIVGFSFRGLVAQRLAEMAPERVTQLVLYACPLLAHFPA